MTDLPKTIAEMVALMAKADPAPWKAEHGYTGDDWLIGTGQTQDNKTWCVTTDRVPMSELALDGAEHDARLIALMRNTMPALLAERERHVAAMRAALNELGVPQPGYPAPVVNAVNLLGAALLGVALSPTQEQP